MTANRVFVIVTSSFPIRDDGSEAAGSFVADLVDELAKHINVRVVAPGPIAAREQWSRRVEIVRYSAPAKPLSTLKPWRPADLLWIVRVLRGGLFAARDAITDDSMHVLAFWGLPCGEWARRAARRRGVDYSVWMLGSDVWSMGRLPILKGLLARVMRQATHAYADGYQLAKSAEFIGKVSVDFLPSTRHISNAECLPPRTSAPYRLLFLGRWHPNKGVDLLLDALTMLDDEDWLKIEHFELQGGGPLEQVIRARVAVLQGAGRPITAGGFLAKAQAEAAIMRADWVVIPSRIESIPLIFSDAMKLDRPVVATPVGDLPKLLQTYKCGVLAEAANAGAIAKALKFALRGNVLDYLSSISQAAGAFSIPAIAEQLVRACGRVD